MFKPFIFLLVFTVFTGKLWAQLPEDALRVSWTRPSGTARQQAIGGAMGSLGGEISAAYVNPAGLAFYKTGDVIITPGFHFLADKTNYRGTSLTGKPQNSFNLGTTGIVFGFPQQRATSGAFSIAINRSADFSGHIHYKGQNNFSSYGEQYAEEFASSGLSVDDAIGTNQLSYGTRMALYTYLIDTATVNGSPQVITLPLRAGLLNQENTVITRGGITEIALSYAANYNDKWYVGGSLGIPILNYSRTQTFTETDATGNTNNDFASSTYTEQYSSKGFGLNAKLGVIYKAFRAWRFGVAVHTPTIYALKDRISANMVTNTENYAHTDSVSSALLDQGSGTGSDGVGYDLLSPWKFMISGSYLFNESEDVTKQRGFITADAEYITNKSAHFSPEDNSGTDPSYFDGVNTAIRQAYKGSFDFRVGGELKFNILMVRAGASWYTSPYRDNQLEASRLFVSGGVGYRNKGIFIDLTYVQGFTKDVNFPYRLSDKANTYAAVNENGGTLLLTAGFKFF